MDDRGANDLPWVILPGSPTKGLLRPCTWEGEVDCAVVARHPEDGDVSDAVQESGTWSKNEFFHKISTKFLQFFFKHGCTEGVS